MNANAHGNMNLDAPQRADLQALITRFLLSPPLPGDRLPHLPASAISPATGWRRAAVLIPILPAPDGLQVLLTRRSDALRHHPGQVSFPGGRFDDTDADLWATALRESQEELALPAEKIHLIGHLPEHHTVSRYCVTPFLAWVEPDVVPQPSPDEVAEVFTVPLAHLLNPANYGQWPVYRHRHWHTVFGLVWQQQLIWGATARMLWQLAGQLAGHAAFPNNQNIRHGI